MQTDPWIDQTTVPFLRAFDAVASCLRSLKQLSLDVQSRGDTHVEISVDRMWNVSHEMALSAAGGVKIPPSGRASAEALLKRLRIWKELARQARETDAQATEFHAQEIWEASDEQALARYESLRAGMIGERELPFMDEAV